MRVILTEPEMPATMPSVSVVIPLFNESENLVRLIAALENALESSESYDILLVDDGSTDKSLETIRRLAEKNPQLRYISLTRNFGHQIALKIGLQHSVGQVVISMDADLQHPPEEIPRMISAWRDGYKVVNMVRQLESASAFKRLTSSLFYRLVNSISDFEIVPGSSDFRLLDRSVVDVINTLPEHCVFLRGMIPWLGYKQTNLPFRPSERLHGDRKYRMFKMLQLAVTGITSSSIRPLRIATIIGVLTSTAAAVYAIYALIVKLVYGTAISGWTSLLIGMMLLGGVQLLMLGVVGEYVGRVFVEVKGRPNGIVADSKLD
jgi:glycosyltransferase involved in cell wall biosynthesis